NAQICRKARRHFPGVCEIRIDVRLVRLMFVRMTLEQRGQSPGEEICHSEAGRRTVEAQLTTISEARQLDYSSIQRATAERQLMRAMHNTHVVIDLCRKWIPIRPMFFVSSSE